MYKQILKICLFASAIFAGHVHAQSSAPSQQPLRFFIGTGLTFGGDKLAGTQPVNGYSYKVTAGGTVQLHAGVSYMFTDKFAGSLAAGYHFSTVDASDGTATFDRYPVEILGHYTVTPNVRIGAGVRLISSAKLRGDGAGASLDTNYSSTTGAVLEGEYMIGDRFGIKLRFVNEKYKASGTQNKVDGNHAGLMFNYYFW
jgi:outer membrane protein W